MSKLEIQIVGRVGAAAWGQRLGDASRHQGCSPIQLHIIGQCTFTAQCISKHTVEKSQMKAPWLFYSSNPSHIGLGELHPKHLHRFMKSSPLSYLDLSV